MGTEPSMAGQVALNSVQVAILKQQSELLQSIKPSAQVAVFTAFDAVSQFHAGACGKGGSFLGVIENNAPTEVLALRREAIDIEATALFYLLDKLIENGGSSLEQKAELLGYLCKTIHALVGLSVNMGLPIDNAFAIVHASNMSKVIGDLAPTGPVFDENGGVVPPEGWIAPDKQIWDLCFWLYSQRVKQPTNGPEATAGQEPQLIQVP